jgi:hypothetical protein
MTGHQVRSYGPVVSTDHPHPAPDPRSPETGTPSVPHYEFLVGGRLSRHRSAWFDGLTVTEAAGGTTALRGPVVDQAALHGLLQKLRDAGIPLISLTPIPADRSGERPVRPSRQEN